jgi:hypothetical protein
MSKKPDEMNDMHRHDARVQRAALATVGAVLGGATPGASNFRLSYSSCETIISGAIIVL